MSRCNNCGKDMHVGTEHVRPDLTVVCLSCSKANFDYQQWRTASAVTPEMLDSCLDRIEELEANVQNAAEANAANVCLVGTWKHRAVQAEDQLRAACGGCSPTMDSWMDRARQAEAALAEQNYRAKQLFEQRNGLRELLLNISVTHPQVVPNLDEYLADLRARAEEGSRDVPSDQQIRDARMDEAIPLERDFSDFRAEEGSKDE